MRLTWFPLDPMRLLRARRTSIMLQSGHPWGFHGISMVFLWGSPRVCVVPLVPPWDSYLLPWGFHGTAWDFRRNPMQNPRGSHGISVGLIEGSMGLPWGFHGTPMPLARDFHGSSKGFP